MTLSRATIAGILSIISILIPWSIYHDFYVTEIIWQLFGVWQHQWHIGITYFTRWFIVDKYLSLFSFIFLLIGAILLFVVSKKPKVGASLVLAGMLFFIIDLLYNGVANHFWMVPIAPFLALAAAILGFTAKPVSARPTGALYSRQSPAEVDRYEQLARLKKLLDSGAISKEEYEQMKKKILKQ